jgi:hypothetical protein
VKNSEVFAEFVRTQNVEDDEVIVSFDVVSLFTSIPIHLAKEVVERKLNEKHDWETYTTLTSTQVTTLLAFVLDNSFFTFKGEHYQQISGCAMGSPISAVIAELVMQEIEATALATSLVGTRWWRRYVDDSNSCLKKKDVQSFHDHLNSIDPNIQFTIELPSTSERGQSIAFLDTEVIVSKNGRVEVTVYRKVTHTEKYLAFDSHNPKQSKVAVVKTLLDRANVIPSTDECKQAEREKVIKDLKVNGYTSNFINNACKRRTGTTREQENEPTIKGYTSIPYIKGVSERVKRILTRSNIRTAYKPLMTLGDVFRKPKDRPSDAQVKGIVYKFKCRSCTFTYIGESKRSWNSRWAEHKPGTRRKIESAIKEHAETTGHEVASTDVEILERGINNYHKRIFLEAFHSLNVEQSVNEHKEFPRVYIPFVNKS